MAVLEVAVTHVSLTPSEQRELLGLHRVAIGTRFRDGNPPPDTKHQLAQAEFDLLARLSSESGVVIANFPGLFETGDRLVGRVVRGSLAELKGIRTVALDPLALIRAKECGVDDLQCTPGRAILDVSSRSVGRLSQVTLGRMSSVTGYL